MSLRVVGGADFEVNQSPAGSGGGSSGDGGSMEARVAVLEQIAKESSGKLSEVATTLERVRTDLTAAGRDIAEVKGRLSGLPSTWVLLTAVVGGQLTLAALIFAALKFGHG